MRALTSQDALCGQDCALHPRHSAWEVGMARARGGRSAEKWGPPRQEGYGVSPLCCPLDAPPGACVWYCTLAPPPGFGDLCPSSHWAPLKAHRSDLPFPRVTATKYHQPGGLHNRNVLLHSPGSHRSEVKGSSGWNSSEGCEEVTCP